MLIAVIIHSDKVACKMHYTHRQRFATSYSSCVDRHPKWMAKGGRAHDNLKKQLDFKRMHKMAQKQKQKQTLQYFESFFATNQAPLK